MQHATPGKAWLQCLFQGHSQGLQEAARRREEVLRVHSAHTIAAKRIDPPSSQRQQTSRTPEIAEPSSSAHRREQTQSGAIDERVSRPRARPSGAAPLVDGSPLDPARDPQRQERSAQRQQPAPPFDRGRRQQRPRAQPAGARVTGGPTQRQILDRVLLGGPLQAAEPLLAAAAPSRLNFSLQEKLYPRPSKLCRLQVANYRFIFYVSYSWHIWPQGKANHV